MKPTARGKVIQQFDDRPYIASIQALRDCLSTIQQQHEAALERYPMAKTVDAGKPKRKQAPQMRHVYVLPAGAICEPVYQVSSTRHFVAPLWASMGEASERKAAA
jgi:hypothetical protein